MRFSRIVPFFIPLPPFPLYELSSLRLSLTGRLLSFAAPKRNSEPASDLRTSPLLDPWTTTGHLRECNVAEFGERFLDSLPPSR